MGFIICIERISRCIEGECVRRFINRRSRVWISRRIFVGTKKGAQQRR